jgi:hypothetical protein
MAVVPENFTTVGLQGEGDFFSSFYIMRAYAQNKN